MVPRHRAHGVYHRAAASAAGRCRDRRSCRSRPAARAAVRSSWCSASPRTWALMDGSPRSSRTMPVMTAAARAGGISMTRRSPSVEGNGRARAVDPALAVGKRHEPGLRDVHAVAAGAQPLEDELSAGCPSRWSGDGPSPPPSVTACAGRGDDLRNRHDAGKNALSRRAVATGAGRPPGSRTGPVGLGTTGCCAAPP